VHKAFGYSTKIINVTEKKADFWISSKFHENLEPGCKPDKKTDE